MKKLLIYGFAITLASLLGGCKIFDNEVIVPGYVYIPHYRVVTPNDGSQGDSSSNIADMWVYSNGSLEGAIGLPTFIPIQKNGYTEIGIDAGVLKSGQDYERIPYPLLTREYFTINISPNGVDTLLPDFKYVASCQFKMIEDFDRVGFQFDYYRRLPGDTIELVKDSTALVFGKNSGSIKMSSATDEFSLRSTKSYDLNRLGGPIFLEMDYKSDAIIYIGMVAIAPFTGEETIVPILNTYPTENWKKAYIELTPEVIVKASGTRFKIYINTIKNVGAKPPLLMLDNIKLIQG